MTEKLQEDKKVVLGTTGGQAGVLGQQLWRREGLGAKALRGALSPPSSLQCLLPLPSSKGGWSRGRMSLLLPLPHWAPWVDDYKSRARSPYSLS